MRGINWLLVGVLALMAALPAHAARRALVVGVDGYRNVSSLKNARADARAMAEALKSVGYSVSLHEDPGQLAFKDALRIFRGGIQGGDEVVVFFSGHGVQIGGVNYLLPADVRGEDGEQVKDDGLPLWKVLDDIKQRKPALTLAIIDACRDNPFEQKGRAIGARGLAGASAATGQMVIFAAGEGQRALDRLTRDDPSPNGLFTRIFVKEVGRSDMPIDRVLKSVRREVAQLARTVGHEQVPAIYDQVEGEFYFRRGGAAPASPKPETSREAPAQPGSAGTPRPLQAFKDCADCPEMVAIPPGTFKMWANANAGAVFQEKFPVRQVVLARGFALGKLEVSLVEWNKCVADGKCEKKSSTGEDLGGGVSVPRDDTHPVEKVSYPDIVRYLGWLSRKSGKSYRLPSAAEWEYAARAGTESEFYWGATDKNICEYENVRDLAATPYNGMSKLTAGDIAPCTDGSPGSAPTGSRKPNPWGLHDMLGNVAEIVADCWADSANEIPRDGTPLVKMLPENDNCQTHVLKGGGYTWNYYARKHAPWQLRKFDGRDANYGVGFRVARDF